MRDLRLRSRSRPAHRPSGADCWLAPGAGPVFGASALGHGMSVKRERPVAVEKAKNANPAGDSESKSMISRSISSWAGDLTAAAATSNVEGGAGVAIGSKPRFRATHARSTVISSSQTRRLSRPSYAVLSKVVTDISMSSVMTQPRLITSQQHSYD